MKKILTTILILANLALAPTFTFAQAEQQRRPQNIDACETLAKVMFKMGKTEEAAALLQTALRTHSQKPERLVLAGRVKIATGQQAEGEALVAKGMALKPYMMEQ